MSGAGFGSFMEGLQGGISSMQDIRRKRQLDKLYDQEITLGGEKITGRDHSRARAGLGALEKFTSGDPFLMRLMDKLGGGRNAIQTPEASALPVAAEQDAPTLTGDYQVAPNELDPTQYAAPEYEFANGTAGGLGDWLDDEKAGKPKRDGYDPKADTQSRVDANRAARKAGGAAGREAIPTQVIDRSAEKTLGQKVAAKAGQAAKYEGYGLAAKPGAGLLSKAGRFAGRAAAPLAIGGAAAGGIRGALEDVDSDASRQLQQGEGTNWYDPLVDPEFYGEMGQRAVGAGKGVVAGLLDPIGAFIGRDEGAAPAPAAPPAQAVPTDRGVRPGAPPSAVARRPAAAAAAPASAIPAGPTTAPAEADPLAGFDVSKIPADQIPNFSNQDWVSFRDENIKELVANGMSYAEAWDKVDQQTVATQQRGFMHFGNQARALLAAKDMNGAAAAVRAAFQYMPTTTDLKVGVFKGHLVAFGVDEESGEQIGTPIVITPEFLDSALMNFSDRKAWAEHAQDNRKLDQADRELGQGDRRIGLMEEGLGIEHENALTNRLAAIGGGSGGLNETNIATARKQIGDWAYSIGGGKGADPALPAALSALAEAEYKRRGGDLSTIIMRLETMMRSPGGPDTILAAARRLASGQ